MTDKDDEKSVNDHYTSASRIHAHDQTLVFDICAGTHPKSFASNPDLCWNGGLFRPGLTRPALPRANATVSRRAAAALILFYVINLGSAAEISSIQAEANPASWFSLDWLTGSRRQVAASDVQNASTAKNVSDPIVPYIAGYKLSSFCLLIPACAIFWSSCPCFCLRQMS
jgi:hypothetical protein